MNIHMHYIYVRKWLQVFETKNNKKSTIYKETYPKASERNGQVKKEIQKSESFRTLSSQKNDWCFKKNRTI